MWVTHYAILSWIMHFPMATLAVPLIGGHLIMAVINPARVCVLLAKSKLPLLFAVPLPASRVGLTGMITGFVDRHWAKHHYRRWYREHHEAAEEQPLGEA